MSTKRSSKDIALQARRIRINWALDRIKATQKISSQSKTSDRYSKQLVNSGLVPFDSKTIC